jgi:trk system potassium uptake protein TrkA
MAMHVVIIGAGHDGFYLAERLIAEGQDVVIIEADDAKAARVQDRLDCLVIAGNGASPAALRRAGVDKADLVLAVSDADGANVIACHSAKQMGARRTVARVEDPDVRDVAPDLGVDVMIDARLSVAGEVMSLVRYPGVSDLAEFAGGRLVLVGGRVRPGAAFAGRTVAEMQESARGRWVLAATVRGGCTVAGRGHTRVEEGDHVLLMVRSGDVPMAVDLLGIEYRPVRRVVVLGGSKVAQITSEMLITGGYEVVLVEADPVRSQEIAAKSDAMVVVGDPTEPELLDRLELGDGDVVVALSGWDAVNLMACMVARAVGAPYTIARFGRFAVAGLLKDVGIDAIVSSRVAAAGEILRFVRRDRILSVATFKDTRSEAMEIEVAPDAPAVGRPLRELGVPAGAVVGGFIRDGEAFLPTGDTVFRTGDHLVVLAVPSVIDEVEGMFIG